MHLEGPWLSTTGKKKGKKKFASAEHARKARELEESWKEMQNVGVLKLKKKSVNEL
jgi:N-acetylglucosamine-6-phosphate deacetylase